MKKTSAKKKASVKKKVRSVGRPTLYDDTKTIALAREYLEYCKEDDFIVKTFTSPDDKRFRETRVIYKPRVPTAEGLSIKLGISRDTLYRWEKEYPAFSDTLEEIRQVQHEKVFINGLSGDYNSTIAKLVLSNNHGYREKQDTDITTQGHSLNEGANKALTKVYGEKKEE